jgi:hypothetical protein
MAYQKGESFNKRNYANSSTIAQKLKFLFLMELRLMSRGNNTE